MNVIIFDLGRVLVDYDHQTTLAATAVLCQVSVNEIRLVFHEVSERLGLGMMDAKAFYACLQDRVGLTASFEELIVAFAAGIQRNEAALARALALQNRPNTTVAVMSNTNEAHVLWLDQLLPELREFELVIMSNEVGILKPDPEIFELALALLAVEPRQVLFIDDLAANVAAACRVGMSGIVHRDWCETSGQLEHWLTHNLPAH